MERQDDFSIRVESRARRIVGSEGRAGGRANALMLGQVDEAELAQTATLVTEAVGRREALGLAGPLTAQEYRVALERLLDAASAGDAGLGVGRMLVELLTADAAQHGIEVLGLEVAGTTTVPSLCTSTATFVAWG
jgi:hypothetical protein